MAFSNCPSGCGLFWADLGYCPKCGAELPTDPDYLNAPGVEEEDDEGDE